MLNTYGATLLNSLITSPAAQAAGIQVPFANFVSLWGSGATVRQALRPYPQFGDIDTRSGGGDHSGHSTYHSGMIRFEKRYSHGVQFQTSYVFSKILTDSDSYWSDTYGYAMNHFNRSLEKSIGQFDVPHNFKFSVVAELPFGKGKAFLNQNRALSAIAGGWRVSLIAIYSSGQPRAISTTNGLPLFAGGNRPIISTYDGWTPATVGGSFDPAKDRTIQPASFFPAQPANVIGNMTRYNPNFRDPNYNENISISRTIPIHESIRLDFRAEMFNAFNRVRFGLGSLSLQSTTFGVLSQTAGDQANSPRQMQLALKLYFFCFCFGGVDEFCWSAARRLPPNRRLSACATSASGGLMHRMRVVQVASPKAPFEIVEREIPEPGPGSVRIKVQACGVCHSDSLTKEGFPLVSYPRVPGHEVVGVVDAVGAGVPQWKPGQRVGVGWNGGHCGYCDACRRGDFFACQTFTAITGITYDGGYAEYMIARAEALALVPEELSPVEAAPLMCAGVTTFNALRNSGARPGGIRSRCWGSAGWDTWGFSSRPRRGSGRLRSRAGRTRRRWRANSGRGTTSTARRRIRRRSCARLAALG